MGIVRPVTASILAAVALAALPEPSKAAFNFFDPADSTQVPDSISATGFYDNLATKQVTAAAVPFEVNTPLWSDAAAKKRWVLLKPGTHIRFKDTADYYDYPDGAVFVKQFAIDTVPGDTSTRILWETRLLVLKKDAANSKDVWYGFSYRWNRQNTNAGLVDTVTGLRDAIAYYPEGRGRPAKLKKWNFPSQNQCNTCHLNGYGEVQARGVLGFFTAQLNRPGAGGVNQISRLFTAGVFEAQNPMPDFSKSPRWYAPNDTDAAATLELKARSYLGANCSGCHGDRGTKNNGLGQGCRVNFDFFDMKRPETLGTKRIGALEYQSTSRGNPATVENNFIIRPEHPEFSSVIWRLEARNDLEPSANRSEWDIDAAFDITPDMMPPLGRYQTDTAATRAIKAWINSLEDTMEIVSVFRRGEPGYPAMPRVVGGQIILDGMRGLPAKAWLVDIRGTGRALAAIGPGRYRLPARMAPGLYSLVLNEGRSFRVLLP